METGAGESVLETAGAPETERFDISPGACNVPAERLLVGATAVPSALGPETAPLPPAWISPTLTVAAAAEAEARKAARMRPTARRVLLGSVIVMIVDGQSLANHGLRTQREPWF
jgi:hypothetical protein